MKRTISGIRGIFGGDLSLKDVLEFCGNFSSLVKSQKCVIGRDTRPSGPMVMDAAAAALMKSGVDVFDLGTAPTPVVFREARRYGAGLVVSSSHNPIEWNGLKFIIDGRGINEQELLQITQHRDVASSKIGIEQKVTSSYLEDAQKIIGDVEGGPRVTVDIGGGAARGFAPELLRKIGCDVTAINEGISGCSRGPDPTSDELAELISASGKRDIGFAFDLDGDRLVVVSGGKKQAPDVTLGLGVAKSLEMGCRSFVLSIDTSIAVEKLIREGGGTVTRSKVGEANVIDLMLKTDAQAGGEGSSGGFVLPEFNYCRDGILASGLIASMLGGPKFGEVLRFMERYARIRDKIQVDSPLHDRVIEGAASKLSARCSETDTLDGVKGVIDEDSWVLIRKSNTEDIIRVSAESDSEEKCKKIIRETMDMVRESHDRVR